jgi:hypothetical protein
MQYAFSLLPQVLAPVEKTMSPARLGRYMGAAKHNKNHALRLYIWNAHMCQEFYFPIQITEVAIRNSVSNGLAKNFGPTWFQEKSLTTAISARSSNEIADTVSFEKAKRGASFSVDHVVAGLSFGFWLSLLNAPMTNRLWSGSIRPIFPHLPATLHQPDVHKRLEKMRLFRNAVMHHYAIFDKGILSEWENLKIILGWICPESVWLMTNLCNPRAILSAKPHL